MRHFSAARAVPRPIFNRRFGVLVLVAFASAAIIALYGSLLNWQGQDNSSLGEYVTGLIENRMSGRRVHTVTLRQVFYEKYKSHTMPKLPEITVTDSSLEISV